MSIESHLDSNPSFRALLCSFIISFVFLPLCVLGQQSAPSSSTNIQIVATPQDPALTQWEEKDKYFLIVAANKTAGQDTNLPYAKVDGNKVGTVLAERGYKKIDTLTEESATRENLIEALKQIRKLKDNSLVIVYYSGHGATDPQGNDLWLQLYGQKYFGESHGLSVGELIKIARGDTYKGELVVIIDACYSAQGAWTRSLSLSELENTLIFASSSRTQKSYPIDISPKETMSAFTYYFLQGLTKDWDVVDENHDGIIRYDDLQTYIETKLTERFLSENQADKDMIPEVSGQQAKIWTAFDPAKAQNLNSMLRQALSLRNNLKSKLAKGLPQYPQQPLGPPSISPRARELAQRVPANADPYTKALQAIAEDRIDDALQLLKEAEKTNTAELADIYQMRGSALIYQGQFTEGKMWYEKALKANRKENPELLEEASVAFFMMSDMTEAETLLKQALEIRGKTSKNSSAIASDLLVLATLRFFQGQFKEADLVLRRIQEIAPQIMDEEEPNIKLLSQYMLVTTTFIQGNTVEAERIATELLTLPENKLAKDDPVRITTLLLLSAIYKKVGKKQEFQAMVSQFLTSWEQEIDNENLGELSFYIEFTTAFESSSNGFLASESNLASRFEIICKRSLDFIKKRFGSSNPELAASLNNLIATLYLYQERYPEAEALFIEALGISDKTLLIHDFLSVIIHNNLGKLYVNLKKYQEAEQSFKKSLAIAERMFGPQSIYVVIEVENLGDLSKQQGEYDDAIRYYKRAIEVSRVIGGPEGFISTLYIDDLAEVYRQLQKYDEATKLYKESLAIIEKSFGPKSQELASGLINLGKVYFAQRNHREAESALIRAIEITQDNSNTETDDFAINLFWLAETYSSQKNILAAEKTSKQAFLITEKLPVNEKDGIVYSLIEIASAYGDQQRDIDAERLYQQILLIYQSLEENYRAVVAVHLYTMAQYYLSQGKYEIAESLFKRAIAIDEKVFGKEHLEVAIDLEALADLYQNMNRYEEALPLYLRSIPIREKFQDQSRLASSLAQLGHLYILSNRYVEALPSLMRSMGIWEKASETNSPEFADCLVWLAVIYYAEKQDYKQAEILLQRALLIDEHLPQANSSRVADDLRMLGNVYRFQHKYDKAEKALHKARELTGKSPGTNRALDVKLLFNLSLVYQGQDKNELAQSAYKRALQLSQQMSRAEQSEIALWLERYASLLRYMKRDAEAVVLERGTEEIHSNLPINQVRD